MARNTKWENGRPYILEQRPWNAFDTVADADAGLKFKTPGLEVYIISEDEFYYWKNDTDGFVKEDTIMGGAIAPTDTDVVSAARNDVATNVYLRGADSTPMNLAPHILPFAAKLIYMSASTDGSETWDAEVHVNGVLKVGAVLPMVGVDNNYAAYNIVFSAGDKVQLFCNGTGILRPRIDVIFRKI